MAIEILENTLLKLLVRRGTDHDRKQITLGSGELGYATDTERLYIGNSVDAGGVLVGNKWKGTTADLTTLAGVITGDYAYDTSANTLNVLIAGDGSSDSHWYTVADQLSAGNTTINIDGENKITVGTLSAGNFSYDALGDSIELDGSNRIALSGSVNINTISIRDTGSTSYLTLPQRVKINPAQPKVYSFPVTPPGNNYFLQSNANGDLRWAPHEVIQTAVSPTTASVMPVATIVPFATGGAVEVPYGWLQCDGTEYVSTSYPDLSAVIGTAYNTGGESSVSNHFRVPNLIDKVLYGSPVDPPVNSNLMGVVTGANPGFPGLSATGMNYIIKAVNGVTSPTLTVRKNLSAFVNGVDKLGIAFNPLSGDVVIERPSPGMATYSNTGEYCFYPPTGIEYIKFYVTGSGANGGVNTGGAAATVIGNISAGPGTEFVVCVAEGPITGQGGEGRASCITVDGTLLVASYGGCYCNITSLNAGEAGEGYVRTACSIILNSVIIPGGCGGIDTSGTAPRAGYEESEGAASYWGSNPAPGAGSGGHAGDTVGNAGEGFVMFEWN